MQEHANSLSSQAAAAQQSSDFCASFAEDMLNEFVVGLAEVAQDIAECDAEQQGQQQLGSDSLDQGGVVTACMHLAGQAVCISCCCMCYMCVTRDRSDFVILNFKAFVHSQNMLVAYK